MNLRAHVSRFRMSFMVALGLLLGAGALSPCTSSAADDPASAIAAYARGVAARAAGNPAAAQEAFATAFAADSTSGELYIAMLQSAAAAGKDSLVLHHAPLSTRFDAAIQLQAALLEAGAWMRARDSTAMLAALRRAVAAAPDSAALHALLAHAAIESGDTLTGTDELLRAAALDSTSADPWFRLGVLRAAQNDLAGARDALTRARDLATEEPAIEEALGLVAQQAGDEDTAQRHFRRAAALTPNSPSARIDSAEALAASGDLDGAAAELNRLRGTVPDAVVERRLMMLWWRGDRPEDATRHARLLMRLRPSDPLPHLVLGYLALDRKDFPAAVTALRAAAARDTVTADVYYALGIALHRQKQDASALAPLRRAVQLMTDSSGTALYALGLTLAATGDTTAAVDTLRLAEAADSTNAGASYALAEIANARHDYPTAEQAILRVLARDSTNAAAWNFLGYMYADAGVRLEEARGYIERALALDPASPAIRDSHGWVLYRLGRFEEARAVLLRATAMAPDEPEIAEHLGDVYVALSDWDAAKAAYQSALRADRGREQVIRKLAQVRSRRTGPAGLSGNSR